MTSRPIASPHRRDTFTVLPVVEYEPPTCNVSQFRQSSHATSRPQIPRAHRRHSNRQHASPPPLEAAEITSPSMRQAAMFADAALRRVLEVIDRRRPVAQLRSVLAPGLVESVLSVNLATVGSAPGHAGAALLRKMRLQRVRRDGPDPAAEVFGTYRRGDRVHAIACRVEKVPATSGARWLVVALHIG